MRPMKWVFSCCVLSLAAFSHASFDLMLAPDAAGGIQRLDPKTGASLGKFGGSLNYRYIEASYASKSALAVDSTSGRLYRLNYSTGESNYTGAGVAPSWSSMSQDGDTVSYSWGSQIYRYSASTGGFLSQSSTTLPSYPQYYCGLNSSFGAAIYLNGSTLSCQGVNGTTGANIATPASTSLIATAFSGPVAVQTGGTKYYVSTARAGTAWNIIRWFMAGDGSISGSLSQTISGFSTAAGDLVSITPAHTGFYLVGRDATNPTTQTRISEFDDNGAFNQLNSYTMNFQSPTGSFKPGIVLAPEPGTFLALGLGGLALIRRRRNR